MHGFETAGEAGPALAGALGAPFGLVRTHRFPDDELMVTVPETPDTVIAFLSLDRPNQKLVQLVLAAEAWRRLGARRLVLAAPYLAYMRQDLAFEAGQAISQKAVAGLLAGLFDRVVTVNAHLHRTHSLSDIFGSTPADDLSAAGALGDWLSWRGGASELLLLGPDEESEPLVRATAERCGAAWTTLRKTRRGDEEVELSVDDPGRLKDRAVVLVDDICSSGATLAPAARRALTLGARDVRALVVHALFDRAAAAELQAAGVRQVVSTDSASHPTNEIALAPVLARALANEIAP